MVAWPGLLTVLGGVEGAFAVVEHPSGAGGEPVVGAQGVVDEDGFCSCSVILLGSMIIRNRGRKKCLPGAREGLETSSGVVAFMVIPDMPQADLKAFSALSTVPSPGSGQSSWTHFLMCFVPLMKLAPGVFSEQTHPQLQHFEESPTFAIHGFAQVGKSSYRGVSKTEDHLTLESYATVEGKKRCQRAKRLMSLTPRPPGPWKQSSILSGIGHIMVRCFGKRESNGVLLIKYHRLQIFGSVPRPCRLAWLWLGPVLVEYGHVFRLALGKPLPTHKT